MKMSRMGTRPLSQYGLFAKGPFCLFIDFEFSAKSDCPVWFASEIILLTRKQRFINAIKRRFKHAPAYAKDFILEALFAEFSK